MESGLLLSDEPTKQREVAMNDQKGAWGSGSKVCFFLIRKLCTKDTGGRHEGHSPLMKSSYVEVQV